MKISSIVCFHTDLDRLNENVLNPCTAITKDDFFNKILTQLYPSVTINENEIIQKGINFNEDKSCQIVISKDKYDLINNTIKGIDYIVLRYFYSETDTQDLYFGFVRQIVEIGTSTVTMIIDYDIWNNNIDTISITNTVLRPQEIGKYNSNNYGITNKSHLPSVIKNNTTYNNLQYKLPYSVNSKYVKNINSIYGGNLRYSILFMKIICSEPIETGLFGTDLPSTIGSLFTYYIPVGIYDNVNKNYVTGTIVTKLNSDSANNSTINYADNNDKPPLNYILSSLLFEYISTKCISATLTFNTPFGLSTHSQTTNFDLSNYVAYWNGDPATEGTNPNLCIVFSPSPNSQIFHITKNFTVNHTLADLKINYFNSDLCIETFPFNYINLKILEEKTLIPNSLYDIGYSIYYKNDTDTIGVKLYTVDRYNNEFCDKIEFDRIVNNKELSFSKDSLQYYLTTKGGVNAISTIVGSLTKGLKPTVKTTRKGNIKQNQLNLGNVISASNNLIDFTEQIINAENQIDIAKYSNMRQEIDLDYIDYPFFIEYDFRKDDINNISLITNIFLYGYDYSITKDLFSISRRYFEYIQCENVHLSICDGYDRKRLEELFIRGFTRNHILIENNEPNLAVVTTSNKNVCNYDMWLESEE